MACLVPAAGGFRLAGADFCEAVLFGGGGRFGVLVPFLFAFEGGGGGGRLWGLALGFGLVFVGGLGRAAAGARWACEVLDFGLDLVGGFLGPGLGALTGAEGRAGGLC